MPGCSTEIFICARSAALAQFVAISVALGAQVVPSLEKWDVVMSGGKDAGCSNTAGRRWE